MLVHRLNCGSLVKQLQIALSFAHQHTHLNRLVKVQVNSCRIQLIRRQNNAASAEQLVAVAKAQLALLRLLAAIIKIFLLRVFAVTHIIIGKAGCAAACYLVMHRAQIIRILQHYRQLFLTGNTIDMMQEQTHITLNLITIKYTVTINSFRTVAKKQLRTVGDKIRLRLLCNIILRNKHRSLLCACHVQHATGYSNKKSLQGLF